MAQEDDGTGIVRIGFELVGTTIPLGLGVEISGGRVMTLIPPGTKLPIDFTRIFSTEDSFQMAAEFNILLGNRPLARDCMSLCRVKVRNIKWSGAGIPKIDLAITMDLLGTMTIAVRNLDRARTDVQATVEAPLISLQTIAMALEESTAHADEDAETRNAISDMLGGYRLRDDMYECYSVAKKKMTLAERRSYRNARGRLTRALSVMPPDVDARSISELREAIAQMEETRGTLENRKVEVMRWWR